MVSLRALRQHSLSSMMVLLLLLGGCGGGGGGSATPAPPAGTSAGSGSGTTTPPAGSGGGQTDTGTGNNTNTGTGAGTDSGTGTGAGSGTPTTPVTGTTPATDPGFRVTVDRSALAFKGEEDAVIAPQVVLGTGSGTPSATVYTGSLDLGVAIERVFVETVGTQVKFTVQPKVLPAGEYRGSLQLFACPDARCATHFEGSPVTIPYTISVAKGFKVQGPAGGLTALSGATASADIPVQLPAGTTSFTARSGADWLTISNLSPAGFSVTAQPMPPGTYKTAVTVVAGTRSREVEIGYAVTGNAGTIMRITPAADSIDMAATIMASADRTLEVALPSWSKVLETTVSYVQPQSGWLDVAKTGEHTLALRASAATLPPGRYGAYVTLASGPLTYPVTVAVNFTVGNASWQVTGDTNFLVTRTTAATQLGTDLRIDIPQLPVQPWTASTNAPWLVLSRASGSTGGTLRATVDPAKLLALPNYQTHAADIVLGTTDSRIAPLTLRMTLNKALPEVHYVGPSTRLPGEGGSYIVRGRGFDSMADLQRDLVISGATPLQVTRVNDTQVTVQLAGAPGGAVGFNVPNQLGAATGNPTLRVVAPATFSAQLIATAGEKGGMLYDPERKAVYVANKALHSVMRFSYNGSSWDMSSVPVPSVGSLAMTPDRKSVVVTSASSGIVLLDPATLQVQASYADRNVGNQWITLPFLAVTNNGRAYFGGESWSDLRYFDLVARQFVTVPDAYYSLHNGPWFSISGDGARLNLVQTSGLSSFPPMLYMDSADGIVKTNPVGLNFWYTASQSLRGERFVEDTYRVWDRDFALIGNLALPDYSWRGTTTAVSPDGARVYMLAFNWGAYNMTGAAPRVYVFDSSKRVVSTTDLPLLGYFTLGGSPSCQTSSDCNLRAWTAISPDGKTLFFAGDTHLVVAPIPATLEALPAAVSARSAPMMKGVRMGH
ncbi:hypothetical protein [Massilia suwonensis]|uniref:IPT/TIG domain-containing protein n=1 Tax=Massilia suwonensis TaxID=648895 RepID=A0ABW0MRR4_9BURK